MIKLLLIVLAALTLSGCATNLSGTSTTVGISHSVTDGQFSGDTSYNQPGFIPFQSDNQGSNNSSTTTVHLSHTWHFTN